MDTKRSLTPNSDPVKLTPKQREVLRKLETSVIICWGLSANLLFPVKGAWKALYLYRKADNLGKVNNIVFTSLLGKKLIERKRSGQTNRGIDLAQYEITPAGRTALETPVATTPAPKVEVHKPGNVPWNHLGPDPEPDYDQYISERERAVNEMLDAQEEDRAERNPDTGHFYDENIDATINANSPAPNEPTTATLTETGLDRVNDLYARIRTKRELISVLQEEIAILHKQILDIETKSGEGK